MVDDDEDAARLLADLLARVGHQTEVASRAGEALALARTFLPEFAVLDLGLPEIDGLELGRRLQRHDRALRLIAVSGYGGSHDRTLTAEAGFLAHLVKPVHVDEVLELL